MIMMIKVAPGGLWIELRPGELRRGSAASFTGWSAGYVAMVVVNPGQPGHQLGLLHEPTHLAAIKLM